MAFDAVVIGGGHAGIEAAAAAARVGARTLLVTQKLSTLGEMSCNPAWGGVGKGILVREVDALGGVCARAADDAGLHFRLLNAAKGPAVHGPRVQADRAAYKAAVRAILAEAPYCERLALREATVTDFATSVDCSGRLSLAGVVLNGAETVPCRAAVLTTGTFLRGEMRVGSACAPGGRAGDGAATAVADALRRLGLRTGRMRTGTPPRLAGDSIDWSALTPQPSDASPCLLSVLHRRLDSNEVCHPIGQTVTCFQTRTTAETHALVRAAAHTSAHIAQDAAPPRYCPSLEAKVARFGDRPGGHVVWLEPETADPNGPVYPNGASLSVEPDAQLAILRTMPGLGAARMLAPGYGVSYDYVDPRQLDAALQTRAVAGLFLAGQLTGTTGYEEAAAQGLLAGANAGLHALGRPASLVLGRADAYVGVMVDDLVARGVSEPYRVFTSRAEFRTVLRADNADARLTPRGVALGLVGAAQAAHFAGAERLRADMHGALAALRLSPHQWAARGLPVGDDGALRSAADVLGRADMTVARLLAAVGAELRLPLVPDWVAEAVRVELFYRAQAAALASELALFRREEALRLPPDLDYGRMAFLSAEARDRLAAARPASIAAAKRLEGVTPDAVVRLYRYVSSRPPEGD